MDIADAYFAVGRSEEAMRFYALLSGFPAYSQPALWLKMGQCQALSGEYEAAVGKLRRGALEFPARVVQIPRSLIRPCGFRFWDDTICGFPRREMRFGHCQVRLND
jgi:hypothetical protein